MGFFSVYFELSSTEGDNHLRNFNDLTDNYDEILKRAAMRRCLLPLPWTKSSIFLIPFIFAKSS